MPCAATGRSAAPVLRNAGKHTLFLFSVGDWLCRRTCYQAGLQSVKGEMRRLLSDYTHHESLTIF
jgi:hypothetical protein